VKIFFRVYRDLSAYLVVPVLSVVLVIYLFGGDLEKLNNVIAEYKNLFISLGTVALVALLTVLAAHLSNYALEHRERISRRVDAELKIAEFRQKWINEMRDDIAEFSGTSMCRDDGQRLEELAQISARIRLRLNLKEILSPKLIDAMARATVNRKNQDFSKEIQAYDDILTIGGKLLKSEWARLKSDVKSAQMLEDTSL